jgi:hypothetical protein
MILGNSLLPQPLLTHLDLLELRPKKKYLWVDLTHNFVKELVMLDASELPKAGYLDRWTERHTVMLNKRDLVMGLWGKENSKVFHYKACS